MEKSFLHPIPIYYDLHIPEAVSKSPRRKLPLLIAFHGYGGDKESMMRVAKKVGPDDLLIASLQGPFQFVYPFGDNGFPLPPGGPLKVGFGWATRWKDKESIQLHHQMVLRLIQEIGNAHSLDTSKIFLLAFSQPAALNYRFVFSHAHLIRGVIAVCGGVPGDWATAPYKPSDTDVLHIATDEDPFYPLKRSREFENLLKQRAAQVGFCVYKGGHKIPSPAIPHMRQWLKQRLH